MQLVIINRHPIIFMKRQLVFIVLLILAQTIYGQKDNSGKVPPRPPTKKEMEAEAKNHHCIKNNIISLAERLKKYPFNVATQIQFVSFGAGVYLSDRQILKRDSSPRINDSILYSRLNEMKIITHFQIDQLTDLSIIMDTKGQFQVLVKRVVICREMPFSFWIAAVR